MFIPSECGCIREIEVKNNIETLSSMIGHTVYHYTQTSDELILYLEKRNNNISIPNTKKLLRFFHTQDCCEHIEIEDICGELENLINHPLLECDEATQEKTHEDGEYEHNTWTFYKFTTIAGTVTIRWHGYSNGYYSESVEIELYELA